MKSSRWWNRIASLYDGRVTNTELGILREFLDIEERLLDDVLINMISKKHKITLIEVGAGTGRTIFSYLTKRAILANLAYLIGLDNAGAMYARMTSKFEGFREDGLVSKKDSKKFVFLDMDAVAMSQYFDRGRLNHKALLSSYGENNYLGNLKPDIFNSSRKIVVNLLNTLGIMEKRIRSEVVRNMISASGPKGKIVVSVFSSECFNAIAPVLYRSIEGLTGKFTVDAFNHEKKVFRTETYYSHWFSEMEITRLMKEAGANNLTVKPINTSLEGFFITADTL
ncbi:MAG: hypothetical protein OEY88_05155 [Candidatus Bathyarchaeota archaeon]|nr:hypothetical protein [Candidatus Bathyarchaeota archaeon]